MPVRHFWVPENRSRALPFVRFSSTTFLQPCKTYGFAYSGCKNIANLERYVPFRIGLKMA